MNEIVVLFEQVDTAHKEAFREMGGKDPEWPLWYASYLQASIGELFGRNFTKSELVYCLIFVDREFNAVESHAPWPEYYADHFFKHFAESNSAKEDRLALYHLPHCPFCLRVREVINNLGLDVELRDTSAEQKHFDDLIAARGRATVPVLHITSPDGEARWIPESADIIQYIRQIYGH